MLVIRIANLMEFLAYGIHPFLFLWSCENQNKEIKEAEAQEDKEREREKTFLDKNAVI